MATVAFIGIGLIGAGLAEAAVGRGDDVIAFNRTRAKADALGKKLEGGAGSFRVVDTAADAVKDADRVHVVLSADEAVDAVLESIVDSIGKTPIIDHTTASPDGVAERAKRLQEKGCQYLAAPVFMSPAGARDAKGVIVISGPQTAYDSVKDELSKMTGEVWYLGEQTDLAASYKLFGNAMIIALCAGLADVFAIAKARGVEAEDAIKLFDHFNPAMVLKYRGANMASGNYDPSFEMTMARKDVQLMIAAAAGETLCSLPAINKRMTQLIDAGHGGLDLGALSIDAIPRKES